MLWHIRADIGQTSGIHADIAVSDLSKKKWGSRSSQYIDGRSVSARQTPDIGTFPCPTKLTTRGAGNQTEIFRSKRHPLKLAWPAAEQEIPDRAIKSTLNKLTTFLLNSNIFQLRLYI